MHRLTHWTKNRSTNSWTPPATWSNRLLLRSAERYSAPNARGGHPLVRVHVSGSFGSKANSFSIWLLIASVSLARSAYGARPISLYSCSMGTMPERKVTLPYSAPIEWLSSTAAMRDSVPLFPIFTVAQRRSPAPSQVSTRTRSFNLPQPKYAEAAWHV